MLLFAHDTALTLHASNRDALPPSANVRFLDITVDAGLIWSDHVELLFKDLSSAYHALITVKQNLN